MSSTTPLEINERNEAGEIIATYICSNTTASSNSKDVKGTLSTRVDVVLPPNPKSLLQRFVDIFLPSGYPASVSEDYLWYQIYDSLQAFSSSIAGLLCSRAVLEGVGVGDPTTTPTSALLLTIAQETLSRVSTIAFATQYGPSIAPECKRYRFLADIFNDCAMLLECLSPRLPVRGMRVAVLCAASVGKALCGVVAGGAKASLSAHFAVKGDVGELSAVDAGQETVIGLAGMLAGSLIVPRVTSTSAIWTLLILLLTIHLGTNYLAVRSVSMRSINRQRANILLSTIIDDTTGKAVLSPQQVSQRERIFEKDGLLRWHTGESFGVYCRIGVSLNEVVGRVRRAANPSSAVFGIDMQTLFLKLFAEEKYILWLDHKSAMIFIVLKKEADTIDQLKAWMQALLLAKGHCRKQEIGEGEREKEVNARGDQDKGRGVSGGPTSYSTELQDSLTRTCELFVTHDVEARLRRGGWDLSVQALETSSGSRVDFVVG